MNIDKVQANLMVNGALHPGEKEGYYGYEPACAIDFPFQEDVFDNSTDEEEETPTDHSKLKDKARTSKTMMVFIVIFAIAFILLVVWQFLVASCKVTDLCETIDLSSLVTGEYRVVTPSFRIPTVLLWIGLTVGCVGLMVATIYTFVILRWDVGTAKIVEIASIIRDSSFKFLSRQYLFIIFPLGCFFFLIGGLVNWSTAGSFALGSTICLVVGHYGLSVATKGNLRTCAAAKNGLGEAMRIGYRTGAVISLWLLGSGILSVSAGYLMFSDVRALGGFAAGASVTTVMVRIGVGLFSNATSTAANSIHGDDAGSGRLSCRKTPIVASYVGTGIGSLFGLGPDLFDSLVGSIIGTAIIGASLPFFFHNPFAMCVFNHLDIDRECGPFGYPEALSYATYICRNEELYMQYPSLSAWSSNSVFVAVPFVLGSAALLVSLITTSFVRSINEQNEGNQDKEDKEKKVWKLLLCIRGNLLVTCILLISCSAAVCFGLFGPNSNFQKNVGMGSAPDLRRMELDGSPSQCNTRTVSSNENTGNNEGWIPEGARGISDYYKPILPSGVSIGRSSSTGLRLFGCNVLGILIGVVMAGFSRIFFTSGSHGPTQRIAESTKLGVAQTIIHGLTTGLFSAIPPTLIIILSILLSYRLYGSYGVGIMTVGFLSLIGHITAAAGFGSVAENAQGISRLVDIPNRVRERTKVLDMVASSTIASGIEFSNGAAVLTAVTFLLALVEHSNLLPSLRELTGTAEDPPPRLIGTAESISILDISVLASLFMGTMIPFVLAGLLMLGAGRATLSMEVSARQEKNNKDPNRYERFVLGAAQAALIEAIIPATFAITVPLAAAFGLGVRGVVGVTAGGLGAGYILGSGISAAGGSWNAAGKIVAENETATSVSRRASQIAARFGAVLRDCVGPSTIAALKIGPVMGLVFIGKLPTNTNRWWVGLLMLIIIGVITLVFSMWKSRQNAKMVDIVLKEEELRVRLPKKKISPFYVDGITINPAEVAPGSQMAEALKAVGNPYTPVDIRNLPGLSRREETDLSGVRNFETLHTALPMAAGINEDEVRYIEEK